MHDEYFMNCSYKWDISQSSKSGTRPYCRPGLHDQFYTIKLHLCFRSSVASRRIFLHSFLRDERVWVFGQTNCSRVHPKFCCSASVYAVVKNVFEIYRSDSGKRFVSLLGFARAHIRIFEIH